MKNDMVISTKEKLAFASGDFASSLSWQTTMMFLAFYFTDVYGVSAAMVGTIFLISRFVDAFSDPFIGYMADKTDTRWGKYRPYILFMAIPFGLISYIPYSAPAFADNYKEIFALISYIILIIGYTAINIPYCSMANVITNDNDSRVSMQGYRFALTALGGLIVATTVAPLADYLGGDDVVTGYRGAMLVMGGAATICFIYCFLGVKERVKPIDNGNQNIRKGLKSVLKNKPLMVLCLTMLCTNIMGAVKFGGAMYYLKYYLDAEAMSAYFLGAIMLGGIFGALSANKISQYIEKSKMYALCCSLQAVACISVVVWPSDSFMLFLFSQFMFGYFFQMMLIPQFSLISDYVDEYEKSSGQRYDGLSVSTCLFVLKAGGALGGALMGWILAWGGYSGTGENDQRAIDTIANLYAWYPTIVLMVVALIAFFFLPRTDKSKLTIINTETQPSV